MSTEKREFETVGARIPKEAFEEIRGVALEESTRSNPVNQSDILRRALSDYLDIPIEELEP